MAEFFSHRLLYRIIGNSRKNTAAKLPGKRGEIDKRSVNVMPRKKSASRFRRYETVRARKEQQCRDYRQFAEWTVAVNERRARSIVRVPLENGD